MYNDLPPQRLMKDFYAFIWDQHPVGREIIGNEESIRAITRKQMQSFIKSSYTLDNTLLVIAGDFSEEKASAQIEEFYRTTHTPRREWRS